MLRIKLLPAILALCICIPSNAQVRNGKKNRTTTQKTHTVKKQTAQDIYDKACDYWDGKNGVDMNREKAKELWLQAAQMGHALAQGECAFNENLSDGERVGWARKSAAQGCTIGMDCLAGWYYDGTMGLPKDVVQSVYWIKKWADTGDGVGLRNYAIRILQGLTDETEPASKAIAYFEKAAKHGDIESMRGLYRGYSGIKMVEDERYSFPKNEEKAIYWLRKAAENGNIECQYNLAAKLNDENDKSFDPEQAYVWFLKIIEKSKPEDEYYGKSCCGLAIIDSDNHDEYDKSIEWLRKGAGAGHIVCQFLLADEIRYGGATPAFEGEDIDLYQKVANQDGNLVARDKAKAEIEGMIVWHTLVSIERYGWKPGKTKEAKEGFSKILGMVQNLKEMAEQGNSRAQGFYANMLIVGCKKLGIKQNIKLGKKYLKSSFQKGDKYGERAAKSYEKNFHESL